MALHAKFAPSSAATWLKCSWSARNAVPEDMKKATTIEAAAEGTRVHALLEQWHTTGDLPPPDDEAHESVKLWAAFISKLYDERSLPYAELRVFLTDECWGTIDFYGKGVRVSTIMDAKNGKWDVPVYHNSQMLTYASALLASDPAEWWRFVIFQPNGLDADESDRGFKQWVAHRSEVEAHKQKVLAAIADRSPPKPGPHCRWCRAFQACPAMAQDANFVVGAMSRRPEDLTTDDLVRLLRLIRALHDNKDAYEDLLTARAKLGYALPDGAVLKPGRRYRSWNDPLQAATHLYEHFGAKAIKPVTPAQAEKLGPAGKAYAVVGAHVPEAELKVAY